MNPLQKLASHGQAVWLDQIHRQLLTSGELGRLIVVDGLKGLTSNPAMFEEAICGSDAYRAEIRRHAKATHSGKELYERLALEDVRLAADAFRPLYDSTEGLHGFVSLEVDPRLAFDAPGTVREARRLWTALRRANVFIKVPATSEGVSAIEQLTFDGINVNVTLLFGLSRYTAVARAFMAGLEQRVSAGLPVERIRSVASFFLSRIDSALDPRLQAHVKQGGAPGALAKMLYGKVAIASARLAYSNYLEMVRSPRWTSLSQRGACPQWLLWGSTSAKNPDFDDVKYVEALIGAETINTMPLKTLDAYRDHGNPEPRLTREVDEARLVLERVAELGFDMEGLSQELVIQGVEKFSKPFDKLLLELQRETGTA